MSDLCVRFHQAVELIGRRWSGAVIMLLIQKRSRYAELRAGIPDISDRMLSERLRELEEAGIVVRTVIPETPVRVEYDLTDKGRALRPALEAIGVWASRWVDGGEEAPAAHVAPPAQPAARRPAAAAASSAAAATRAGSRPRPRTASQR